MVSRLEEGGDGGGGDAYHVQHARDVGRVVGGEGNGHPAACGRNGCKAGQGRRRHFVDDNESESFSSGAGV